MPGAHMGGSVDKVNDEFTWNFGFRRRLDWLNRDARQWMKAKRDDDYRSM